MDNHTIDFTGKKGSHQDDMHHTTCPFTNDERLEEFERAHRCIADIISNPSTGVCYVRCVSEGKIIDVRGRYLIDDKVTIDDITFTKNPDVARRWIISGKNIGVYTGIDARDVIEDNVAILDIDLRDVAPDADPEFLAPREIIDNLIGQTLTIETRSGGLQCIFKNTIGATGSPKLRYVDPETGYLADAGDTRIKHAYALFAGSYVPPDQITTKRDASDPLKPFKKPLPHADGLYRAIHIGPIADLTHDLLDELGLSVGTRRTHTRTKQTISIVKDGQTSTRSVDALRAYSSYGNRKFNYTLTHEEIQRLASLADIDRIRNNEGKTLESLSYLNTKVFNLIKLRTDYSTRGVTSDESESAENIALAYEMRKLGFDSPDIIAMALLLYHPREKNFEIRGDGTSHGISYLADTVAGAFDHYNFEYGDGEHTDEEIISAANSGGTPFEQDDISTGRGYSHLYEFYKDDPNITYETWTSFPPYAPTTADITIWRGDPRAGKSYHGTLYLSQHESGNYITHRHEIVDAIFPRLVDMTSDTAKTIVKLEGKHRCCPNKSEPNGIVSCHDCPLRPVDDSDGGGISYLEYQNVALSILNKHRAICKDTLLTHESDYCPYYILKFAEPEANYCVTVSPFLSPIGRPDSYSISPRDYLVIDEEPTIGIFYPAYPAIYEYHRYGFASKWDTNHLVHDNIVGQMMDIIGIIKDKNPQRVTKVNKAIRDICEAIIRLNREIMRFSDLESKGIVDQEAFIRKTRPLLPTFEDFTCEFKHNIMDTFMEHVQDLKYIPTGDPLQYIQPFLYPAPDLLVWQQGSHPNSPKQILYLMSAHTPMFTPDFYKMLIIGATESEVFVDHIRGLRPVCRVDLELFPYQQNYLLIVASDDSITKEDVIVRGVMSGLLDYNKQAVQDGKGVVPFVAVTGSKSKQSSLLNDMAPHGKILGLGEHDTRSDVVQYYNYGLPVAFYNNGTIARGIDLPEYDVLFFVDGSFATPRFSALEASAKVRDNQTDIKRYRQIRKFLMVDECTNSAYRTAPLYNRKAEKAKILVISHKHLNYIYDTIYKHSCVIPVEMDTIENAVRLITRISGTIQFHTGNSVLSHLSSHICKNDLRIGSIGNAHSKALCDCIEDGATAAEKYPFPLYYREHVIDCSMICQSIPGLDYQDMRQLANGPILKQIKIKRDGRTQKTYNMVVKSVMSVLRGSLSTPSVTAIVNRIYKYKKFRKRRVTKAQLTTMIDEMVLEGMLLYDEACDFSALFSEDRIDSKIMVKINPDYF